MLNYKIEKKADGWYVAGERFPTQTSATRHLSALFTGKATPKTAAASAPKKKAEKPARRGFTELGWDADVGDLVNGDALEGFAAKVIGTVAHPPEGMNPDVTSIVIVEHAPARGESVRYTVVAFDDEAVYQKDIYKRIPDVKTAEMLAKAAWTGMNNHAGLWPPELRAAMKKYATKDGYVL